ncbi:hypothetical protein [Azospirillum halopraeferens]|uniref:hypothetical protein n=1 Tax=Azospirillum halopraeferens TaxID=34010 RepID=UPI00040B5E4A|nr:hypothetical protein [Azospirillum halopraeferens]
MIPLLMFASGVVVGAAALRLLKSATVPEEWRGAGTTARTGVDRAQAAVREATLSGLSAVERTSAGLRARLTPEPAAPADAEAVPEAAPAPEARTATPDEPPAAPVRRRRPRKAAPPTPADGGDA